MKTKNINTFQRLSFAKGTLKITPEQWFLLSALVVNVGNYAYNLIIGRLLGPERYAEASLLVTLLLVLSFVAMTLQLTVSKFQASIGESHGTPLLEFFNQRGLIVGTILAVGCVIWTPTIGQIFHIQNNTMLYIFALSIPFYFIMSVRRGVDQGNQDFGRLAISYQSEMWARLIVTLCLLLTVGLDSGIVIAIGILVSIIFGLLPRAEHRHSSMSNFPLDDDTRSRLYRFAIVTGIYELSQVLINNCDILMVKHYFDAESAGLYAALAMIGRVVYFLAWMFIMMLLPKVIGMEKNGENSSALLMKYIGYTTLLGIGVILSCLIAPELIVNLLFGAAYLEIAPHLWLYALATTCFAVANTFTYYALSLDRYIPIAITVLFGVIQIALIQWFHQSIIQVVCVQVIAMASLLLVQMGYHFSR